MLEQVLNRIDNQIDASTDRLINLLRIASISTDPKFAPECDRTADWLVDQLTQLGFEASKRPTPGHPMVVAHTPLNAHTAAPDDTNAHLLFYGHYDVQPVDPLALWDNDPFDPQIEDTPNGRVIRGRGSSDDKGQLMTFVEACRAWRDIHGYLPKGVSILFEGEEESGSPSLIPFLRDNADELTADLALICDTGLFADRVPAIITRLRGLVSEEITINAANKDLHSGMYGGVAINPIRVLSKILAHLHDDEGRITVPQFYDDVKDLPEATKQQWRDLNFDTDHFLGGVGLNTPAGECAYSPLEQIWSRPTCEINGIIGGYTGEGFKTVLPAQASAKVSFRLVSGQDPEKIRKNFRAMVTAMLPKDCTVTFTKYGGSKGTEMQTDHRAFDLARRELSAEWGADAVFAGCGGSIPIAGHFKEILAMDAMLIGFGKDDDRIHSPNEKYDLKSFHKGIRSWARILAALQ